MPKLAALVLPIAWCAYAAGALAADGLTEGGFSWSADGLSSDFRSDTLDLSGNVRIVQGEMSIEAGNAQAQNVRSQNSRWTFDDSVHIRTAEADLRSDSARAAFVAGELADARVVGAPALFEQRGATTDAQVRGRAGVIEYDPGAGTVTLSGQVWFSNGKDEFRGDVVIYNLRDQRVQINPGGQSPGRVRGIIRPRNTKAASDAGPASAAGTGADLPVEATQLATESGA